MSILSFLQASAPTAPYNIISELPPLDPDSAVSARLLSSLGDSTLLFQNYQPSPLSSFGSSSWDWLTSALASTQWVPYAVAVVPTLVVSWVLYLVADSADKGRKERWLLGERAAKAERRVSELSEHKAKTTRLVNERDRLFQEYVFML